MTGDGLVRPMNAPGTHQPVPGVQPGSPPAFFNRLVVAGPKGGIFYYASNLVVASDTPQRGNLAMSVANVNTTDPYHNAVLAGTTNYVVGLSLADAEQVWAGQINYYSGPNSEAGPWTLITSIGLGGPGLQIGGGVANTAVSFVDPVRAPLVGVDPSTTGTAESWHTLGTLANYTVAAGQFRLVPQNGETEFDINVTSAGANAATTTFSVTIPAPYRPLALKAYPLASTKAIAAGDSPPRLVISAAGAVSVVQTAAVSNQILGGPFMPTN